MVAPSYSAQRSALAKTLGLGRKAASAPPAPAAEPAPAPAGRNQAWTRTQGEGGQARRRDLHLIARRSLLAAGAASLLTRPAAAQPIILPKVQLQTSLGAIVVELRSDRAPVTAANFLRYVDK